jgi:hypothetical protein
VYTVHCTSMSGDKDKDKDNRLPDLGEELKCEVKSYNVSSLGRQTRTEITNQDEGRPVSSKGDPGRVRKTKRGKRERRRREWIESMSFIIRRCKDKNKFLGPRFDSALQSCTSIFTSSWKTAWTPLDLVPEKRRQWCI